MTRGQNVAIALGLSALGAIAVAFGDIGPEVRGMNVLNLQPNVGVSTTASGTPVGVATTAGGTPEGVISADRTRNIMFETLTAPAPDGTNN